MHSLYLNRNTEFILSSYHQHASQHGDDVQSDKRCRVSAQSSASYQGQNIPPWFDQTEKKFASCLLNGQHAFWKDAKVSYGSTPVVLTSDSYCNRHQVTLQSTPKNTTTIIIIIVKKKKKERKKIVIETLKNMTLRQ